ncbi:hypothetical protein GCM10023187_53790 [Nibrella viscosa]|uniref:DUF4382 domain-containing protein n=1 Tax=Nibrella viscosa TaxID=1084524 RepID=A0ABP8KYV2_9BACT
MLIAGMLITCRRIEPEPDRLFDGLPRLKSISFAGIPQENISIDQKTRIVSVKMPSILLDRIGIALDLTDNAEWVGKNDYIAPRAFGCDACFNIVLKDKKDVSGSLNTIIYTVKTFAQDPIKVALLSQPISYTIRGEENPNPYGIDIPMVNLYGNKLPKEAHLNFEGSGEKIIIKKTPLDDMELGVHFSRIANRLGIHLYNEKLRPGTYQIELLLEDGTILKVSQPLLVYKGTPEFKYEAQKYFGYRIPIGNTFTVEGYNLFEGDFSFDLVNSQGRTYPLLNLVFEPYGRQIQVPVPSSLAPGQYVLRVYLKGVKQPDCLRLNVLKDDKPHPVIGTLVTNSVQEANPCSLLEPVMAQRGVALFFTSNQEKAILDKLSQHLTLKLVSVNDNASYYASVVPYDYSNSGFPGSFTIPATVPPGLYTAILQVLDAQNNVVDKSEPYGRVLNVQ